MRLAPAGADTVTLELADSVGELVAGVESLTLREASGALTATDTGRQHNLFQIDWAKIPADAGPAPAQPRTALPGPDEAVTGDLLIRVERPTGDDAEAAHALTAHVLGL
ncbi:MULTISPECIES: hypothetical protein, partial [unclassified Streptomyces]|uniref:hypothetical protein n=1 Tax=unclassified Streptomyces TaxID=2593676 RepID=UPI0040416767